MWETVCSEACVCIVVSLELLGWGYLFLRVGHV